MRVFGVAEQLSVGEECVRSHMHEPRPLLTIQAEPQEQALQAAQQRAATKAFQSAYAHRAGIEAMIWRGPRSTRVLVDRCTQSMLV
jgi:hypothetical protein